MYYDVIGWIIQLWARSSSTFFKIAFHTGRFLRTVSQYPSYIETVLSPHLLQIRALRLDNYEINAVDGVNLWDDGLDYSGHDLLDIVRYHLHHQYPKTITNA